MQQPPGLGQPLPGYPSYQPQPGYGYPSPLSQPQSRGKIALKYGLIFGAILVAVDLLHYGFNLAFSPVALMRQFHLTSAQLSLYTLLQVVIFTLIYWGIYFCAGLFTARTAQQTATASIACLWASLCYFVIYCLLTAIGALVFLTRFHPSYMMNSYITSVGIGFVIMLFAQIGLGCGIGALGGLVGKNLVRKEPASAVPMR